MKRVLWLMAIGAALIAAKAAIYAWIVRPWHRRWGAAAEEVYRILPGDDLIPEPKLDTTHAVTINAPAEQVWPWLVQMGQGRGGFYTYAWLENMMGLEMENAERILPEHQDLNEGDTIPLAPDGIGLNVALLEPRRHLVLHGDTRIPGGSANELVAPDDYLATSWGFYLFPQPNGTTRLVERWKADYSPKLVNRVMYPVFLEPGAFVMERGMLLGLKERAERDGAPQMTAQGVTS